MELKNFSVLLIIFSRDFSLKIPNATFQYGEFVKKNNVKRQQEYANLILFQVKLKDGN